MSQLELACGSGSLTAVKEKSPTEGKPLLDVDSFQQLLEAAYVLQKHNEQAFPAAPGKKPSAQSAPARKDDSEDTILGEPEPTPSRPPDYSQTLAEIVALQHEIQTSHPDLQGTMDLIADHARRIAHADGVTIGLLEEENLVYKAARGSAEKLVGARVKPDSCLSAQCLSSGETVQCPDVARDPRMTPLAPDGVKALVAVPIYYEGSVLGALEIHFAKAKALHEQDVRTCQLMAGLVTEAKARSSEQEWKQALAAERASMLEALEKLKPQLQRLAGGNEAPAENVTGGLNQERMCPECGSLVGAGQLLCGVCGSEPTDTKSKDKQRQPTFPQEPDPVPVDRPRDAALPVEGVLVPWPGVESSFESNSSVSTAGSLTPEDGRVPDQLPVAEVAEEKSEETNQLEPVAQPSSHWSSAVKARKWLEASHEAASVSVAARLWKTRRADFYLGFAVILFVTALWWGMGSKSSTTALGAGSSASASPGAGPAARRKPVPQEPKLTFSEKVLVALGLADPPPVPVSNGNPDTKVWVDLQTALYYCPGTDLYGKTPKGKFTSQRDAQMDQFEPAYRKACE